LPGVPARFANCCKPLSELKVAPWWCGPEDFSLNDIEKKASRYWVQIVASLSDWQTSCIPSLAPTETKCLVKPAKLIYLVIFSGLLGAFSVVLLCFVNGTGYSASCRASVNYGLKRMWTDTSAFSPLRPAILERSQFLSLFENTPELIYQNSWNQGRNHNPRNTDSKVGLLFNKLTISI